MRWLLLVVALSAQACVATAPILPPPPPVAPAPASLQGLAIHVHRLVTPAESAQDAWDYQHMPGYTSGLRAEVAAALQAAGYTVVIDRRQPHDAIAVVQGDFREPSGVATLSLTDLEGRRLATVSAPILPDGEYGYLQAHAAAELVDALAREAGHVTSRLDAGRAPLTVARDAPSEPMIRSESR